MSCVRPGVEVSEGEERLRGIEGVAQLVDAPRYPGCIVLADAGGTCLADLAKPLPVDELIAVAVALVRAVAEMHRRAVIHRDITPANIVLSRDGVPSLVDFSLATSSAEIRPEFIHHTEIVGTSAYLMRSISRPSSTDRKLRVKTPTCFASLRRRRGTSLGQATYAGPSAVSPR